MVVPEPIFFNAVPLGGVMTSDGANWFIKVDDHSVVNLATGALNTSIVPGAPYTYFSGAALCFK